MKTLLRKLLARKSSPKRGPDARRTRPQVEGLEERQVMTVTFHGGSVLPNVEATPVFYGSRWHLSAQTEADAAYMTSFLQDVTNSPYMDMLGNAGYGVGRGSAAPATFASDGWSEPDTLDASQTLSDGSIQNTLQWWIQNDGKFAGLQPDANRLYVIFVEPGVVVADPNGNTSANGTGNILGYHDSFGGQDAFGNGVNIRYAVVPYADGAVNNALPWLTTRDSMTQTTSHELAEAVTDPDLSAWYENGGGEIGEAGVTQNQQVYLDGYAVQRIADQNDQPMTPSDATAARPVSFVVESWLQQFRYQLYPGGPTLTGFRQVSELFENSSAGFLPVTFANGNAMSNIRSISDQGIDAQGNAMIDVVTNSGYAYEVHDQYNFTQGDQWPLYLGSNVKDAKAGQGESYLLYNSGTVYEYKDRGGSWWYIDSNVSAIDAGTDSHGVNMEAEVWYGQAWTFSDSTGWQKLSPAANFAQVSAGRQGFVGLVDDQGQAYYWNPNWGTVVALDSGVSKIAMGYDQYGGLVIDELFTNGNVYDWRNDYGWRFYDYNVRSISKAKAGIFDDVSNAGNVWEFDVWGNYSLIVGTYGSQVA